VGGKLIGYIGELTPRSGCIIQYTQKPVPSLDRGGGLVAWVQIQQLLKTRRKNSNEHVNHSRKTPVWKIKYVRHGRRGEGGGVVTCGYEAEE